MLMGPSTTDETPNANGDGDYFAGQRNFGYWDSQRCTQKKLDAVNLIVPSK